MAYDPPEQIIDYAMTKAGIVNFTKGLAKQLAERQIRVNAVAPGPFWTPLQPSGGQDPQKLPQFGRRLRAGPSWPASGDRTALCAAGIGRATYTTGSVFGATGGEAGP